MGNIRRGNFTESFLNTVPITMFYQHDWVKRLGNVLKMQFMYMRFSPVDGKLLHAVNHGSTKCLLVI